MPTTDSASATVTLTVEGVWIHDPLDAEATAENFRFGASQRSTAVEPAAAVRRFAGRVHPVIDHGIEQNTEYAVSIDVVNGEGHVEKLAALADFATARRTLCLRDNRGRAAFGVISRYAESDQDWGVKVSFTFTAVDYDEGEEVTA